MLETALQQNVMMTLTEVGALLHKNPSVIAQYAKAGIVHPIQQGCRKLISLKEVHILDACLHAVEYYGCSYTACKILKEMLKRTKLKPEEYKNYLQEMEKASGITQEEVSKYVNSYKCRGIFQKQKAEESKTYSANNTNSSS